MGRRKGQIAMMGSNSLLVKDKKRRQGHKRDGNESFLHTTDLNDGTTYNRINFQSVTEQSNLEDFLTTAELAGKDFTAERQNITIISNPGQSVRLTDDDLLKISQAQDAHRDLLRIPRRPTWDATTTKEELIMMERDSLTDWRRQLKTLEDKEHIQLTPFEKNLDFWRQLWRVIERSDVVVQIVDARNPLLFRCEDLETYVKEVDPRKTVMLLINKADYLNIQQRNQWVDYFNKQGVTAVFFSAKVEKEKQEGVPASSASTDLYEHDEEEEDVDDDSDDDDAETGSEVDDADEKDNRVEENKLVDHEADPEMPSQINTKSSPHSDSAASLDSRVKDSHENTVTTLNSELKNMSVTDQLSSASSGPSQIAGNTESNQEASTAIDNSSVNTDQSLSTSPSPVSNKPDIMSSEELLNIFRKLGHAASSARSDGVKTIGMVGYPNVGKSSTINVILNQKKLAVSATPGRTKHLQTLYVDEELMLCDCPGLVFPSFVSTKAHLVINGILPIDELRDHVSPVNLVCEYIPRTVLEATYSIMIPRPSLDDSSPNRPPTAEELLTAYGAMRGFMTPRGVPDCPRASRYILKDYVKGKLLYCEPPPGIPGPEFQDQERISKLELSRTVSKVPPPQIRSDIDREFFAKSQSKAHSRGVRGVSDFVRVDTLQPTARTSESSVGGAAAAAAATSSMGSMTSINSLTDKPWKRHNNRNKKEKLRRVYKDLDAH